MIIAGVLFILSTLSMWMLVIRLEYFPFPETGVFSDTSE
jgi:hypothetical protein